MDRWMDGRMDGLAISTTYSKCLVYMILKHLRFNIQIIISHWFRINYEPRNSAIKDQVVANMFLNGVLTNRCSARIACKQKWVTNERATSFIFLKTTI